MYQYIRRIYNSLEYFLIYPKHSVQQINRYFNKSNALALNESFTPDFLKPQRTINKSDKIAIYYVCRCLNTDESGKFTEVRIVQFDKTFENLDFDLVFISNYNNNILHYSAWIATIRTITITKTGDIYNI